MNVTRTLLAARQAVRPHASPLAASTSVSAEAFIQQHSLPLSVQRYINRQVRLSGQAGGSVQMANPFINTWKPSPHAESQQLFVPAVIPRRRQKQLMELYPPHVLPPSPINPVKEPLPIKLEDGTIVEWTGEFTPQSTESTLYSSRKRAFKGTKAERTAPVRAKERAARLKGMEKRIAEWKKDKALAAAKEKPSLPF